MRRFHFSLLALTSIAFVFPAAAQTVSRFAAFASPTTKEYQAGIGAPVTSGVLDFYDTEFFVPGSRNVLGTWGNSPSDPGFVNRPTNIGSSTAMFATQLGEEIDIFGIGSNPVTNVFKEFTIFSMDVGHLYSTAFSPFTLAGFTLNVFGFGTGTGFTTIQQSFTIAAPVPVGGFQTPVLQTLTFDNRWRSMSNVWWSQSSGSGTAHQFTNVSATLVPEPSTYVLMVTGFMMIGVAHRRRRKHD